MGIEPICIINVCGALEMHLRRVAGSICRGGLQLDVGPLPFMLGKGLAHLLWPGPPFISPTLY